MKVDVHHRDSMDLAGAFMVIWYKLGTLKTTTCMATAENLKMANCLGMAGLISASIKVSSERILKTTHFGILRHIFLIMSSLRQLRKRIELQIQQQEYDVLIKT